jgi:hypothetical protein
MKNDLGKIIIGNSLVFYPEIKEYFDLRYPGLIVKKSRITAGEHKLELILKHLSTSRDSTCEDIAKKEHENNKFISSLLKTTTDNIREFIDENLIPQKLIKETGKKKIRNHYVVTYSLTLFGILYAIHLFSKKENPSEIICNLEKNYSSELPKIFGMFKKFEKVIGNEFEKFLGFDKIGEKIQPTEDQTPHEILDEFIPQMHNYYDVGINENDLIPDQISFFIYNHLKENLVEYYNEIRNTDYKKYCKNEKIPKIKKPKGRIRKTGEIIELPDMFRNTWNMNNAEKKWIEIINSDPKIKKWYSALVQKAITLNKEKNKKLKKIKVMLN